MFPCASQQCPVVERLTVLMNDCHCVVLWCVSDAHELMTLLVAGQVDNVIKELMLWLHQADSYLADSQPLFGNLDTVSRLIDEHQVISYHIVVISYRPFLVRLLQDVHKCTYQSVMFHLDTVSHFTDERTSCPVCSEL